MRKLCLPPRSSSSFVLALLISLLFAKVEAQQPCPTTSLGDFEFHTQASIDAFGALYGHCPDIILGNVLIGYDLGSSSDITDLSPLANVKTITGRLHISKNPSLPSLNRFPALTSIGGDLTIENNAQLQEIDAFHALTSVGTYLDFYNNYKLGKLNGFPNLTSIGAGLYIWGNSQLTDISGLQNINPATILEADGLYIVLNPQLEVCNLSNFCIYLSGPGKREITGNKTSCFNEQAILEACILAPDNNNILYVNSSVSGGNNKGNNWANAAPQLADALKWANEQYHTNPAVFEGTPLKIYVARGTYKPLYRADNLNGSNSKDRDNAFVMVNNVQLYGGFASTESTPEERNYAANPSILSGDIDAISGLSANDAHHVVISAGDVGSAILDGFTITGGYITSADDNTSIIVNSTAIRYERGSGLSLSNSSPRIRNTIFTGNRAFAGAVSHTNSNATYVNTLFTGNIATYGTVYNATSSPVFINSTFSGNTGTDNAGNGVAMRNVTSHPEFYNSIIWGNHTANGNVNTIFNSGGGSPTSIPVYQHSLVQRITTTGGGNLSGDADPLFKDAANGDYRPEAGSPVINAGSNTYFEGLGSGSRDLAGNPRLLRHYIDLGAYESDCGGATLASGAEISRPLTAGDNYLYNSCDLLAVVTPENANGSITVSTVSKNDLITRRNARYVSRYYQIAAENTGDTDVTLFFTQADFDHYNSTFGEDNEAKLPDNLRIARYPDGYTLAGTSLISTGEPIYIEPSVALQWNVSLELWEVTFTTPGFSGFFITGQSDDALPVTLVDFIAKAEEQSVVLAWHTASETDFSHFEAERSRDGKLWQKLDAIPAIGASERGAEYRYRDQSPLSGLSYYRLKMIDRATGRPNGNYEYSPIRSVVVGDEDDRGLVVYPNPTTHRIYFEAGGEIAEVLFWDMTGRLVKQEIYQKGTGTSLAGLGSGMFWVEARLTDETARMGRVVVQP